MELTPTEERLVECLRAGVLLDMEPERAWGEVTVDVMWSWDPEHDVRAEALRHVLLGGVIGKDEFDPRGVLLRGINIVGRVDLDHMDVSVPLSFDSCYLAEGLSAEGARIPGLRLSHSNIDGPCGFPPQAGISLQRAKISGVLSLRGVCLMATGGRALAADGMEVTGGAFLDYGFQAHSADEHAVCLAGAKISGQLSLEGAYLASDGAGALAASGIEVAGGAFLDGGFEAKSKGNEDAVCLAGAKISGQLSLEGAYLASYGGRALAASGMEVTGGALLSGGFRAERDQPGNASAVVDLSNAGILGTLRVGEVEVKHTLDLQQIWDVDGLHYAGYPSCGFDAWLSLLQKGTANYRPQPFQQLAAQARALGHDGQARKALIAQRNSELQRGEMTGLSKAWARFMRVILGYGYRPWLALVWMFVLFVLAWILQACLPGALLTSGGGACNWAEQFQVAVGMTVPLSTSLFGVDCVVSTSVGGHVFRFLSVVWSLFSWVLAGLFIAALTGVVRKR